jgi:hypothetical protein
MYIGSIVSGKVKDQYTTDGVTDWLHVWLVPAGIAAISLVFLVLFFKDRKTTSTS